MFLEHGAESRFRISDFGLRIWEGMGSRQGLVRSHLPSASVGHYASLSFVVRGKAHSVFMKLTADG